MGVELEEVLGIAFYLCSEALRTYARIKPNLN
jgi:hypothetical protein